MWQDRLAADVAGDPYDLKKLWEGPTVDKSDVTM